MKDSEKLTYLRGDRAQLVAAAWTVEQLLSMDLPELVRVMGPISNGALVLISAATGVGKTQLAIAMTHAMATGQPFLGMAPSEASKVLHIDGEMPARTLQDRFSMYGPWPNEQVALICRDSMLEAGIQVNFADPVWQESLLDWATDMDVIQLDNVYSLMNVPGQTMSSDTFWRTVEPLNNALRGMGKTVIWYDHTNTAGQVFGTKTKEWQMDLTATLAATGKREKQTTRFRFEWDKVRGDGIGLTEKAMDCEMTANTMGMAQWSYHAVLDKEALFDAIAERLEAKITYREIADELHCSFKTISKIKKELAGR